jgi:UDP-N-acetyl-D-mannosaminuronate dehydrogenase
MKHSVLVVGLGEVGRPLIEVIEKYVDVVGIDIEPVDFNGVCDVLHICFPFQIDDFVGQCIDYINKYQPRLTVINSTVAPGTTRVVFQKTGVAIAYSPVRGKHIKMKEELLHYVKFVGGIDQEASERTAEHFQSVGMKTKILSSPEAVELAKLTETTYFGLLIAWAQELERYCDQLSLNYDEIISFYDEIGYLPPVRYFPGVIGGHCVMPNVEILQNVFNSKLLDVIVESNQLKRERQEIQTPSSG